MNDECARVEALLVRAAEGTLSTESRGPHGVRGEEARLNEHLKDCASCRAALADQRAMRELLRELPVDGARLGFDTRVMAAIRAEVAGRSASWMDTLDFRRWTWRLVPVAAALAIASFLIAAPVQETTVVASNGTDDLPVSAAWWSESVSGSSLLSLMLTANPDDTLATHRKDQ